MPPQAPSEVRQAGCAGAVGRKGDNVPHRQAIDADPPSHRVAREGGMPENGHRKPFLRNRDFFNKWLLTGLVGGAYIRLTTRAAALLATAGCALEFPIGA
ncbi:MAG: hypothetical protein CMJ42_00575 [Phyllobacteriaceae bacterium]|nr:hypothetical protein [Phyllobacteriaceae bacterium]